MSITDPIRSSTTFSWLHLSDIHVGIRAQTQLWPRFSTVLQDDLKTLINRAGPVDVVIFSGDMAQTGATHEFVQFEEIIGKVLDEIGQLQDRPKIITIPGNHDLVRPAPLSPEGTALKQFWHNEPLREAIFEQDGEQYRSFLESVFHNYSVWQRRSIESGVHLAPASVGHLAGDATYILKTAAGQLGVAALNSTWLQLSGSDYLGHLHVDSRQLLKITTDRPDEWALKNDVSLLVTHHPAKWLHLASPASWANDISPPGRFDLHLCGHMHEPETTSTALGGGSPRRIVQAASLFGLETFGNDGHQRIQGYSANRIEIAGEQRIFTSWPRRLVEMTDGRMKLVPDSGQDIEEGSGSFSIRYDDVRRNTVVTGPLPIKVDTGINIALVSPSTFDLAAIQHAVGDAKAHQKVRRVEQETCVAALRGDRVVWLAADWGMGQDGFVSALRGHLAVPNDRIYSIDFDGYTNRETFFDSLRARFGVSFQRICEAVADAGPAILILDDVEVGLSTAGGTGPEGDLESLAKTVADYASDTFVIIRSPRRPRSAKFQTIELRALDEADVAIYARESEIGGERYGKPDAASTLLRHTDGIPTRIDAALRDLEIISLRDLISSNPDFGQSGGSLVAAPPALIATVQDLQRSDDRAEQRSYNLLLALAALPQGEQLTRLKRFLGPHQFGPMHARALLERSLLTSVPLATLDGLPNDPDSKALVVPRPVRDYVRGTIDDETASSIDRKALDLYFGDNWATGEIRNSPTARRVRGALCDGYEVQNAITLILRATRRALDRNIRLDIDSSVRLAFAFIETLIAGDHFRSAAGLCEDTIRLLEEANGFSKELNSLRYQYARSLRMIGRISEACVTFKALDQSRLTRQQRQSAELGLALCHQRLGETEAAVLVAKRTVAIDETSHAALQANVILAEQIVDPVAREAELRSLLAIAKRTNSYTVTNNIILILARDANRRGEASNDMLKQVIQSPRAESDFYNVARAIVDLASQPNSANRLTVNERDRLIETYHFLHNERLYDLFERCHAALWNVFECDGDRANLLKLFRYSSFIWRLIGQEEKERRYLAKLVKNVSDLVGAGLAHASRDGAYFVVRVTVVLGGHPTGPVAELGLPRTP